MKLTKIIFPKFFKFNLMFKPKYLIMIALILLVLAFIYHFLNGGGFEMFGMTPNYQWVTQGTCKSNNMQDISKSACSSYLRNSNYTVTGADHGPAGCWLVLGNELDKVVSENPQLAGKGFGCWSNVENDGKQ